MKRDKDHYQYSRRHPDGTVDFVPLSELSREELEAGLMETMDLVEKLAEAFERPFEDALAALRRWEDGRDPVSVSSDPTWTCGNCQKENPVEIPYCCDGKEGNPFMDSMGRIRAQNLQQEAGCRDHWHLKPDRNRACPTCHAI